MNHELTEREIDILKQISEGKSCKQIGNFFTIKNHLVDIRYKLDAVNTIHAIAIALRRGIIS